MFDADHREAADAAHVALGRAHRNLLAALVGIDRSAAWEADGARDCAHWVQMRYGISLWKAERWVQAAHELETLPAIADALASGLLSIDKVAELTRFATFDDEDGLVRWAQRVPAGAIRHRADVERRREALEAEVAERTRSLTWRHDDDRFEMHAELPTADGEAVRAAVERLMERIPTMPGEDGDAAVRRADALVALCRSGGSAEGEPRPATVVIHARLDGLAEGTHGCEIEAGPAIAPAAAERLVCNARLQTVVEDARGEVVRVGRLRREPPSWMLRQLRFRDRGCVFPGCGTRRFTEAHHVVWWSKGGATDLENLVLICSFHHRLVHEHGWRLSTTPHGEVRWFRADGERFLAGPSPGGATEPREAASA
jgi:Domain of unknown function (DUF222)/HNH endonuclease